MIELDEATVAGLIDLPAVTDATEAALAELGRGEAATTMRVRASIGGAMASAMAAVLPSQGILGGKLYSTVEGRMQFMVTVFSLEGTPLALVDGNALTEVRTAAATAVAIRHLRPERARVAALFGTGHQAWPHLQALAAELELDEVRLVGRNVGQVNRLQVRALEAGIPARVVADPAVAVEAADVVVTVTSAERPLFPGVALRDGALVCAVGSTKPHRRELDGDAVARADTVVVDSVEGAPTECGDLIHAVNEGCFAWDRMTALSEVVAGEIVVPRPDRGIVLFESLGIALQDLAAAAVVLRRYGAID